MTELSRQERLVLDWIETNRETILNELSQFIQQPSLTGEEGCGQEWIEAKWSGMGLPLDIFEPDIAEIFERFPEYAQFPTSWQPELDLVLKFEDQATYHQLAESPYADVLTYEGRANVVATAAGTGGGRSLILNGHVDVVTVGDETRWSRNPFGGLRDHGRIYGRGAVDMKGGLVAMTAALEAVRANGVALAGDVILQSVVNEEHSGNGSLACLARGYRADAVICTEPTGAEGFSVASGGGIYFDVVVEGFQTHSGARWIGGKMYGVSAIEKMAVVVTELIKAEAALNADGTVVALGLGQIWGGEYATSTAAECRVSGVAYFSPALGQRTAGIERIKAALSGAVDAACEQDEWLRAHRPQLHYSHYNPAFSQSEDTDLVQTLQSAAGGGLKGHLMSSCDAGRIASLDPEAQVLVYGPGNFMMAHSVDEYIEEEQVIAATKNLALTIMRWCG